MKISNPSYFTVLILFFTSFCFSQSYSIKGVIQDENKMPIAFANVVLNNIEHQNTIKGTITNENGSFIFENLKEGNYTIKITFLGFETYSSKVELNRDIDFETLIIKEIAEVLNGVTIVAKRPTIKRLVDRTVFNVENSTLSNNNVLDVLKHTPGVLVNNDKIIVKSGTPTVFINDRKVYLSPQEVLQLLEGTPANNIKSIEVITNPPAKYEADGGAILNIITSKNIIAGYNGSVFGNFKQGSEFPKYALGSSHFFKAKKLNTYLNYNISPKKEFTDNNEFINFINEDSEVFSSWDTNYKKIEKTANQNINLDIDYQINENNSLSFSSNLLARPKKASKTNTNSNTLVFGANKVLDSTFNSVNSLVEQFLNLAYTLNYIHKFDSDGEQISMGFHHTNHDFSFFQDVNTDYFLSNTNSAFRNNRFETFSSQKIRIYTSQIDYELPFENSALFEAGAKISSINSNNMLDQFIAEDTTKIQDLNNSDVFLYDETIFALYLSYAKDWGKWSLKSGIRIEYTDIKGSSLLTSQINNNDYFKFFPTIYLTKQINSSNKLYFNYNKRVYRPSYSQLNPFKYFLNDNTFITGDPNLMPQIDDQLILGYTFKDDYNLEAYYRNEDKPILLVVFQDNANGLIKYANTNIDRSISYGLDFSVYKRLSSNWNLSVVSSLFYYENKFKGFEEGGDLLFESSKWTSYLQTINYFTFLKDKSLSLDVSYIYISPWAEGPSVLGSRSRLNIALRKTLWNDRASISLGIVDALNKYNFVETSKYFNQDIKIVTGRETRLLTLGFNYKFGNYTLHYDNKPKEINERNRIDTKN